MNQIFIDQAVLEMKRRNARRKDNAWILIMALLMLAFIGSVVYSTKFMY